MTATTVMSVQTGRIAPLGPDHVPSGFVKKPVTGRVELHALGLDGDSQADLSVHGGPDKAVYGYAGAHYAAWTRDMPQHEAKFIAGGMGENLTLAGIDEAAICVGDIHAIGSALLQVCQPRQPCFKLALHFEDLRMPRAMVRSGRAGWYYRVLETGAIGAGDAVILRQRPNPDFAFGRLVEIVNHGGAHVDELKRMTAMPGLAHRWQARAREALG